MGDISEIGDWKKISVLGSGAFGVVSLWKNKSTEECIAIKKCKFHTPNNITEKQTERWKNEVQIMKTMNHLNVISFKTLPPELEKELLKHNPSKLPLLSMEYCRKGNLRHVLRQPKNICGLEEDQIRCILKDISAGLSYLHKMNITHRDVKPDNIVLQECNDRPNKTLYKIIDLGYAKEIDGTVSFVGTLHYVAPEIFLNLQYNFSVDYWSLGILTFEIVCGVLPFLPHLGPFERFQLVKNKGPDDICIYKSYSGRITYSTEIKKEHHISSCLKQNIETWLKHVFQFDQNGRAKKISNNVDVFQFLIDALNKNIINVFSVYKLEFYSYEVNDCTLWGTLKDWISRDIKTPKADLIMLFQNAPFIDDDSVPVLDLLKHERDVFVIKKGSFLNDKTVYNFPKLIRELFSMKSFDTSFMKQLYAQTIFYISFEDKIIEAFGKCFDLYLNHMKNLCEETKRKHAVTSEYLTNIMTKIESYSNLRKNNSYGLKLSDNLDYKNCLCFFQRLLSSFERSVANFELLEKKIQLLMLRQSKVNEIAAETKENIINSCGIKKQFKKVYDLLEEKLKDQNDAKKILSCVSGILSETIKMKDKVFSKKLKLNTALIFNVSKSARSLILWITVFDAHLVELFASFKQNEVMYCDIIKNWTKPKFPEVTNGLKQELRALPIDYLIKENHQLRHQFEDIISNSILAHKEYAEGTKGISF